MGWLTLLLLPSLAMAVSVPITGHWNGGFQGNICIDITAELTSWEISVHFSEPITSMDVYNADVSSTSADKQTWVLHSKSYNAVEHPGDQLCVGFQGHGSGDITPTVTAEIKGMAEATSSPGHTDSHGQTHTTHGSVGHTTVQGQTAPTMALPTGGGIPATTVQVKNDWGTSFETWFDFDFPTPVEGWLMKIHFSKPVASVQPSQARIIGHNADGTEWTFANDDNTIYLKPGSHFQLRTNNKLAAGASPGAPEATAVITNLGYDNNTVPVLANGQHSKYNYYDVLQKSILFYEAQRSGKLPPTNRIPWRGDSALGDHGDNGEDLSGGWYDAGDYVKFNFPMAWATVILEWGFLEFEDAYKAAGQVDWFLDSVRWPLDYLLKCHVADDVLYAQVGNGGIDHGSWGRPEEMTMARPAYKIDDTHPGSDLAMETAAAFAAGYLVFKTRDAPYATKLLAHAKTLWDFGIKHQGKYSSSGVPAAGFYDSNNVTDENCWGSLWLYKATGEQKYLDTAKHWYDNSPDWGMSWDDVIIGNQLLMYNITGDAKYKADIEGTFHEWLPGGSVPYTPKGLPFRLQWGSLRYASNMAFAALVAAEYGVQPEKYRHWAMCVIHYALGDAGHSFVVGFGENPPVAPHHRASSCPWAPALCNMNIVHIPTPNVHTLYGALVGGPGQSDDYKDTRENYVNNEVANDYNAGFQSAVAGLLHLLLHHTHPEQTGDATCPYH